MTDPTINPITLPVTSLQVHLSGEYASGTLGYNYSPTGGVFVSGNGYWSYDFVLMSPTATFSIQSFDSLQTSNSIEQYIQYTLPSPSITHYPTMPVSSLNISLSGYASSGSVGFIFSPTGGFSSTGYAPGASSAFWNYDFTILDNVETFSVQAYDAINSFSQPATLNIYYEVPTPVIFPIHDPVSSLAVSISGAGSSGATGFAYSPTGGVFASGSSSSGSFWSYDFTLLAEKETFRIQEIDVLGNLSSEATQEIRYAISPPTIITPGSVKSLTDKIASTGSTASQFVSLAGNFFEDGVVPGDTVLAISGKNKNESQNVTQVTNKNIIGYFTYAVQDPPILDVTYFECQNGSFTGSGVQIGDIVTALNGANSLATGFVESVFPTYIHTTAFPNVWDESDLIEISRPVSNSYNTLITAPFSNAWEPGDEIAVYSSVYRPNYISNSLKVKSSGTCSNQSRAVIFSTENLQNLNIYSTVEGDFLISSTGALHLEINGYERIIQLKEPFEANGFTAYTTEDLAHQNELSFSNIGSYFPQGSKFKVTGNDLPSPLIEGAIYYSGGAAGTGLGVDSITICDDPAGSNTITLLSSGSGNLRILPLVSPSDIVSDLNSYFPKDFFFEDQNRLYVSATSIKIYQSPLNDVIGMPVGEYVFGKSFNVPEAFTPKNSQETPVDITVDLQNISFSLVVDSVYTKEDLLSIINSSASKQIAFWDPSGITIAGSNQFRVNVSNSAIGFSTFSSGYCSYVTGTENWDVNLNLLSSSTTLNVYSFDHFFQIYASNPLAIIYKIDPPVLEIKSLITSSPAIDLTGSYNSEGLGVRVDSDTAYTNSGSWKYTLQGLSDGPNDLSILTLDKFGGTSDPLAVTVTYNDPNAGTFEPQPESPVKWNSYTAEAFTPEQIKSAGDALDKIFSPILTTLGVISSLLSIAKAFLKSVVIGAIAAVRALIQDLIDQILTIINIFRGNGLYILNTFPTPADMNSAANALSFFEGGFSTFKNKLVDSFDDPYDSNRPQFGPSVNCVAFIVAIDSANGIGSLIDAWKSLNSFLTRTKLNLQHLNTPKNIKAKGENERVILTWDCPDVVEPTRFLVYRTLQPGGVPITKEVLIGPPKADDPDYNSEYKKDSEGDILKIYTFIGSVPAYPLVPHYKFIDGLPSTASEIEDSSTGSKGIVEQNNGGNGSVSAKAAVDAKANQSPVIGVYPGVTNYFSALKTLTSTTSAQFQPSSPVDGWYSPRNGTTYFYKVIPHTSGFLNVTANSSTNNSEKEKLLVKVDDLDEITGVALSASNGGSVEVKCSPKYPNLISIEEDLSGQLKGIQKSSYSLYRSQSTTDNVVATNNYVSISKDYYRFYLQSNVYNPVTGLPASSVRDIEVYINGHISAITTDYPFWDNLNSIGTKAYFDIPATQNITSIKVKYFGTKKISSVAKLVGRNVSFVDPKTNIPSITIRKDSEFQNLLEQYEASADKSSFNWSKTSNNRFSVQIGTSSIQNKSVVNWLNTGETNTAQNVVIQGTWDKDATSINLPVQTVASRIRNQLTGARVYVNSQNQICIEDATSPGRKGYIEIKGYGPTGSPVAAGFAVGDSSGVSPAGSPPNWYKTSIFELVPDIEDLLGYLQDKANSILNSISSSTETLIAFIDLLQQKIIALSNIIKDIQDILNRILNIMKIDGGFFTLWIPPPPSSSTVRGNAYLQKTILTAPGAPTSSEYTGGIMFTSATPATETALQFIFGRFANPSQE